MNTGIITQYWSAPAGADPNVRAILADRAVLVTYADSQLAEHIVEAHNTWLSGQIRGALRGAVEVLDKLPQLSKSVRERRGISLATAAAEIGIVKITLRRMELGEHIRPDLASKVMVWLADQLAEPEWVGESREEQ